MQAEDRRADRKRTGQFYTPPEVARFLLELLGVTAPEGSATPRSMIDPACGQGVFVEAALDVLSPRPLRAVGVDLYPQEGSFWDLDSECEQVVGDGLLEPQGQQFDLVAGNPPFHGDALKCIADPDHPHAAPLLEALIRDYELWRRALRVDGDDSGQLTLPGTAASLPPRTVEQLSRYPVELAFLDRFVSLCRPGGFVVVVLPEGIAANRRLQYVRDWVQETCFVLAVISLPRGTFRKSGTSAVTTTLVLRRRGPGVTGVNRALLLDVQRLDRLEGLLQDIRDAGRGEGTGEA